MVYIIHTSYDVVYDLINNLCHDGLFWSHVARKHSPIYEIEPSEKLIVWVFFYLS